MSGISGVLWARSGLADEQARTSLSRRVQTLLAIIGPGLIVMGGDNEALDGGCATRVGIANDSLLIVRATYTGQRPRFAEDPCGEAESMAFAIITQMLGSS